MDKPIDNKILSNRKIKVWSKRVILAILIFGSFWIGIMWLAPQVDQNKITLATVEKGDILQTLSASGTVIPAAEYTINSPVVTEIKSIKNSFGAKVAAGTEILQLDQELTRLEFEKLKDELALKANNIERLKLQYDKELKDLVYQFEIKSLQISEVEAQIQSQTRLKNVGGAANEDIEKAKLNLKILEIEKKLLESDLQHRKKQNLIDKTNLELELQIQSKRLAELQKKLKETTVTAHTSGVITWINENIGKTVQQGEPLVKIANLNNYRVEAFTSDRHQQWLKNGNPVSIKVNNETLEGTIIQTFPSIENNTIKFQIALQHPDHKQLRPNQKVDVYIITEEKKNILRVKNGPAMSGADTQKLFKVKDGVAEQITVTKGLTNPDYIEITSGLALGDQIIISDCKNYLHLSKFNVEK